jgi:hypothetical protein
MRGEGSLVRRIFLCRCDCGRKSKIPLSGLTRHVGATRSCGYCSYAKATTAPAAPPGSRYVPLTGGEFALVDEADYEKTMCFQWSSGGMYPHRSSLRLHVFLMGRKGIDHINGDKLDNRRANLRFATQLQNSWNKPKSSRNTSGFKGVSYDKRTKKWVAHIKARGVQHWLGRHDSAEAAAAVYDAAAHRLHGEFARTNGMER